MLLGFQTTQIQPPISLEKLELVGLRAIEVRKRLGVFRLVEQLKDTQIQTRTIRFDLIKILAQ